MSLPGRCAALAAWAVALMWIPAAGAADYCVGVTRDGCATVKSLGLALDAANADPALDRVFVGEREEVSPTGPFADLPGHPVQILGAGAAATTLTTAGDSGPVLRLSDPESLARWITVRPESGASGPAVELMAGAELADAIVLGGVAAVPGGTVDQAARAVRLGVAATGAAALVADRAHLLAESVDASVDGTTSALRAECSADADAALTGRHLTVTGTMGAAAQTVCDGPRSASMTLANSVLAGTLTGSGGAFLRSSTSAGSIATSWSLHPADPDAAATDPLPPATDPGFVSAADHRLRADSALVDAGDPLPLAPGEGLYDAGELVRAVDGTGDGAVRRDVGAHERQPPPVVPPAGNVLTNSGAESADLAGWSGTGGFESAAFGADDFFPTRAAGSALGAGGRFFAGGTAPDAALVQRIDVAGSATAIDAGRATSTLSGLLGGYAADGDEIRVEAVFRDPAGEPVGTLALAGPTPAERGNATNLLPRAAAGAIPPRTRAVDVTLRARRVAGAYTDGYADNLALELSVPGSAVPGPVDPGKPVVPGLKPFAGVTVLTARPPLSRKAAIRIGLGCESATVGRCTGRLELRAVPRGRRTAVRIARFGEFSIRPGRTRTVTIKLLLARRRAFMRHRSFRANVLVTARDSQGLERRKTVPVRVTRR